MKKLSALLICLMLCTSSTPPRASSQPNIVLIFMDDMGYGDLSCYGAMDYKTPNIDKLATEGIRFTNFLVGQAVCSASRAALLTGCYPNRIGISGALMPYNKKGLNPEELTIAEMLKQKNYATGIFGKWHLGHNQQHLPLQHGFDEYYGLPYSNDMWPVNYDGTPVTDPKDNRKKNYPPLPIIEGNTQTSVIENLKGQDLLTQTYTQKAINFINKNSKKPFFLYLPHSMPHVPLGVSARFKGKSKQGMYGDVLMEIDWSVGQIMKTLQDRGLDKNTLVILTSDNGPWMNFGNHAGSTGGLRQGKGGVYEGGMRVPCIMRWKGVAPAGVVSNQLCSTIDLFPTIAILTGTLPSDKKIDGIDISNIVKGDLDHDYRTEYHYYYANNELRAVRKGNWKLLLPHFNPQSYEKVLPGNDRQSGKYETVEEQLALYDLRRDPGERYDVQAQHPDKVKQLHEIADKIRLELGDKIKNITGKQNRSASELE